jgi:hypothetical protein
MFDPFLIAVAASFIAYGFIAIVAPDWPFTPVSALVLGALVILTAILID